MSKTVYAFFALMALTTAALQAQPATISGKLTDAATGEALIGATIIVDAGGTTTNFDGTYSLTLPAGRHLFTFRYVGYEAVVKEIELASGQQLELNQALKLEAKVLDVATVTSGRHSKPLSEVTVSLEVLRPDLIQSTGKVTLDQALEKIPGVTIIDGQANIRGGSGYSQGAGSRVLLLVDDIPILTADAGFPNWDDIPVENIAQVEVLKGAASALFGSSAMNGIINVRTAYAKSEPETEAAVYFTHYFDPADQRLNWWSDTTVTPYTTGFQLAHRRKIGKLDLVLGGYYLDDQNVNKDAFNRFGRFNFSTRYRFSDRLTFGLNGNLNAGKSAAFFYWRADTLGYEAGGNTLTKRERVRYNVDPFINYYDRYGNRHRLMGRYYNVNNNNEADQSNASQMQYTEYQFQRQFAPIELVITAGAVYQSTAIQAELYGDTTFSSRNFATYLQLDKKFFDRLNVSFGFRYEDNRLNNPGFIYDRGVVEPSNEREAEPVVRLGLNYKLAQATFLRASWGQGYRFPTVAEKFILTNVGIFDVVPNPGLGSETGWTAELGLKQGFKLSSFEGFVDVAFFTSLYSDMIEFNLVRLQQGTGPARSAFRAVNIGGTEISGFEVTVAGQGSLFGVPVSLLTGYTFVDPLFKEFDKTPIPAGQAGSQAQINGTNSSAANNVLKYRSRHLFKFDLEANYKGAALGVETFYNSDIEAIDAAFMLIINGLRRFREENDKGFTVVNLRTSYAFSDHVKLSFLVNNIANSIYSARPGLLEPPRNLTARMDFKF